MDASRSKYIKTMVTKWKASGVPMDDEQLEERAIKMFNANVKTEDDVKNLKEVQEGQNCSIDDPECLTCGS